MRLCGRAEAALSEIMRDEVSNSLALEIVRERSQRTLE